MELAFVVSERNQGKATYSSKWWPFLKTVSQWICTATKGFFSALFVPSSTDQQIEKNRERARELMARSY
ncbi:MAG: hypothetical protein KF681_14895 [Bdellovibrionaceae bacterium]|nr:hypothetical protein [Pseudobdellovibrionaceae bacterium]